MGKAPMWLPHECEDETLRGDRQADPTLIILKMVKEPDEGFPNKGQFQITLSGGAQGFFINSCPFCTQDLTFRPLHDMKKLMNTVDKTGYGVRIDIEDNDDLVFRLIHKDKISDEVPVRANHVLELLRKAGEYYE